MRGIAEEGWQVLSLSEEPDDVDVISGDEVEPAAREAGHAPEPQSWNSAQLSHAWRAGSWHAADRVERGDRGPEEPFTELVVAFGRQRQPSSLLEASVGGPALRPLIERVEGGSEVGSE